MNINHIVAMSTNRVIGRDGGMPWHIPEDFKFFKQTTMGHAMIMGRKTWESIGRALPGRQTIVVSRSTNVALPAGVVAVTSVEAAIKWCREHEQIWGSECFIVGGGEIYQQTLALANKIYLTEVHREIDGDTFYPVIPQDQFSLLSRDPHLDAPIPYTFTIWSRS